MMMNAETKFKKIVEDLNKDFAAAYSAAIDKIHSEIMPYVNDDTEHNAIYRASDIVSAILSGNYEVEGDKIKCMGWVTTINSNMHNKLVDSLAERCSDIAAQKKIERLEQQIKMMESGQWR
jgi:hypothetical protein